MSDKAGTESFTLTIQ